MSVHAKLVQAAGELVLRARAIMRLSAHSIDNMPVPSESEQAEIMCAINPAMEAAIALLQDAADLLFDVSDAMRRRAA